MIIFVVNVYYIYIIVNLCSFQFCYLPITRSSVLLLKRSSGEKKC